MLDGLGLVASNKASKPRDSDIVFRYQSSFARLIAPSPLPSACLASQIKAQNQVESCRNPRPP